MDRRLEAALGESVAWYDDVHGAHGLTCTVEDGLWTGPGALPFHSAVKTLRPGVPTDRVVRASSAGGVADSFGDQALEPHGFRLLLEATWWHHPAPPPALLPVGWSVVVDRVLLAHWSAAHDYVGVLTPALLEHPHFEICALHRDGRLVGGAALHDGAGVVGLSNTWGEPPWPELLGLAAALRPGRSVVGYDADVPPGATALGPQRVWVR